MNESQFCQGTVFRADVAHYKSRRGFGLHIQLKKVKKFSCDGCMHCNYEHDTFENIGNKYPIINIEKAEHKKLYYLKLIKIYTDDVTKVVEENALQLQELTQKQIKEFCSLKELKN